MYQTADEALAYGQNLKSLLPNVPLLLVAGQGYFDVVATKDWREPHPRNTKTPQRKAAGWQEVKEV